MSRRVVALVGAPNTGKSSLFNALTGAQQRVGNYPGVTIEKRVGQLKTAAGHDLYVLDLPGTYSLEPQSADERVVADILFRRVQVPDFPDVIIAIADAANLERTLGIVVAVKQFGIPMIVALNMHDLATRRGLKLDIKSLEAELGAPVIPTVALHRGGVSRLLSSLDRVLKSIENQPTAAQLATPPLDKLTATPPEQRQAEVDRILKKAVIAPTAVDIWTRRLDRVLLHPVLGGVFLVTILVLIFQAVFSWARLPMSGIEWAVAAIGTQIRSVMPDGPLESFIVDSLVGGVGSVIVFLPQILILFFFILLLEGSGYMARAAFITDRIMGLVGLQGRSFLPLLSSFACAVPGIMSTRTIRNPRDRLLTIMIAPLMTCSARLPVYVLLIGAFVPNIELFGPIRLQGAVMFGLFLVAILSAMIVASVMKSVALPGTRSPFLIDLPTYKVPQTRYIVINLWLRAKAFVKKAGTIILLISMALWFLSSYPTPPEGATGPAINYSIAGRIGHAIEPLVRPIGFDWRIATGLIPGFAAREVMVSALGTVFAVEDAKASGLQLLQQQLRSAWSVPTGLSLLAWYVFAPQCMATLAVTRRETNSRKWTAFMFLYMLALAYLAAFVTYRVAMVFF